MKQSKSNVMKFLRKNAVYLMLALCILAIGLATALMLINNSLGDTGSIDDTPTITDPVEPDEPVVEPEDPTPEKPDEPVVETVIFVMPVASVTSVVDYSNTMVFNSTLGRYTAHLAIDFFAEEGTDVLAVYGGTVTKVDNSLLTGVSVTIDHGNGLVTVYNSLADGDMVSVGDVVKKGDVIGQVSTTNRQEYKDGAHLHFEVLEDGKLIDPAKYLEFDEK